MKKSFLLYVAAILLVSSMIGTSCRKHIIHSNAPTPNNVRMLGYTRITTINNTVPVGATPSTINENYRFYYDDLDRVVKMLYTSNDSFEIHRTIEFTYKGDSIFKTTTNTLNNTFVERDTFILNSNGLLVTAYTPHLIDEYEYYGKLLARHKRTATSWRDITMTAQTTYTSVNGDFLKNYYDGKLLSIFNNMDTPLTLYWLQDGVGTLTWRYNDYSYLKTGYNHHPVYLYVKDTNNRVDSVIYPGKHWVDESYHFYTETANRTGDYLQLESFTMYGVNIFQNSHLVESITNTKQNADIKYAIDAFSKITQTRVEETDNLLNKVTYVYDIQYETY